MKEKLWYLTWQAWEQWWWNNFANATHHVSGFGSYYRFYNDILGLVGIANIAHWFSGVWVTSYSQCPTHSSASALGLTFGFSENRCRRKSVYSKSDLCVVINFGKVDLWFSLGFLHVWMQPGFPKIAHRSPSKSTSMMFLSFNGPQEHKCFPGSLW